MNINRMAPPPWIYYMDIFCSLSFTAFIICAIHEKAGLSFDHVFFILSKTRNILSKQFSILRWNNFQDFLYFM